MHGLLRSKEGNFSIGSGVRFTVTAPNNAKRYRSTTLIGAHDGAYLLHLLPDTYDIYMEKNGIGSYNITILNGILEAF